MPTSSTRIIRPRLKIRFSKSFMVDDNVIRISSREKIESEAAEWIMRLSGDSVLDTDRTNFSKWLNESTIHREVFEELSMFWDASHILEGLNDYANSDVAQLSKEEVERSTRMGFLKLILSGSVAASIFAACIFIAQDFRTAEKYEYTAEYRTEIGKQQRISLPDGSTVILNTDSLLKVGYTDSNRHLELVRGEALFEVAEDLEKPFSVFTQHGSVKALGTAFAVMIEDDATNLLVTEGRVELKSTPSISMESPDKVYFSEVVAGQEAKLSHAIEHVSNVRLNTIEKSLDWQDGELSFKGESLEEVVEIISRYTDVEIEFENDEIRQQKIVAYYKIGDVERLFEALNVMAGIKARRMPNGQVFLYNSL